MLTILLLNETAPITFGLWLLAIPAFWLYVGLLWLLWQRRSWARRRGGYLLAGVVALIGLFCYEDLTGPTALLVAAPVVLGLGSRYFRPLDAPARPRRPR